MRATKAKDYRSMAYNDLLEELEDKKKALYRLRVQVSLMQMKDTASLNYAKKDIARIMTVINEKQREQA
ncbi:MAG: 50S ribosomal protein L29 [Armatimonadetes bacterium]|nr:50S ribosomal protein L29 [Armatimonadota bacterium]